MKDSVNGVRERLRTIFCDLLLLERDGVRPEHLLFADLDVDSITLLELSFAVEKEFGVEFPAVKASEETFNLLLPDALRRLEEMPGGTTFFEYIKEEAIERSMGVTGSRDSKERMSRMLDDKTRAEIFRSQNAG